MASFPYIDDIPIDNDILRDEDLDEGGETYETPQGRSEDISSSSGVEISTSIRPRDYEVLKQEVLRTKLSDLYDYLRIEGGNLDLVDLNRFRFEKIKRQGFQC